MRFKKFYKDDLDEEILQAIDERYQSHFEKLEKEILNGNWTPKQNKVQKASILQNIALYRTFLEFGISNKEALELVRKRAYHKAHKLHGFLNAFSRFPKFSSVFRHLMKKAMKGDEIWNVDMLKDDERALAMNITKCLWFDTCEYFGHPELCEVFCLSDFIIFGNIKKMDFERNQTLGMHGSKCDFCFTFKQNRNS